MSDYTPAQTKAIELFTSCLKRSDKANASLAAATTEANEASAELTWVAGHPALNGIDLNAIVEQIRSGSSTGPAAPVETPPAEAAPAPKRKRRTKAQIAEDEAREAAEKAAKEGAPAANESDDAAQQVEGAGVSAPAEAEDDTFSEAEQEAPAAPATPASPAQTATNPFAQGNNGAATPPPAGFTNPFAQPQG